MIDRRSLSRRKARQLPSGALQHVHDLDADSGNRASCSKPAQNRGGRRRIPCFYTTNDAPNAIAVHGGSPRLPIQHLTIMQCGGVNACECSETCLAIGSRAVTGSVRCAPLPLIESSRLVHRLVILCLGCRLEMVFVMISGSVKSTCDDRAECVWKCVSGQNWSG